MPTILGSMRRLALTPSLVEVTFARRGFPRAAPTTTRHLEAIPSAVICGFEWGIDARDQWELESRLSLVDADLRGFAYEGATMACTVRDAMRGGRGTRTRDLLRGPGEPHIFLAYIGIGFAMARLPRALWRNVIPDLPQSLYHPTMSWLAVDGYGFDRAYFDTARWVDAQHRPRPYPWLGHPAYFLRAVDQGIGRALWFIHGADVTAVAQAVNRFPEDRRADLWSGVGLAATFAGGCSPAALAILCRKAGGHGADLAQGAVFAARARVYSGHVPAFVEDACRVLTGVSLPAATELADRTAVPPDATGPVPAYELWRSHVRAHFDATKPVT